ncbi:MAG: hypothetical protein KGZ39_00430 [Simkania sp.]|nr:hypothetical protein [Simkania sp.]
MTIIRCQHSKNYSVINNTILSDVRLSFKAKGVWTYAMSRPDGWTFHISHLATISQDKETAIYSAIKELQDAGYCHKQQIRDEKGKILGFEYVFYETPIVKNSLPQPENPDVGNPDVGNPPLTSTDVNQVRKETVCAVLEEFPPSVQKKNLRGEAFEVKLDDVYRFSIQQNKDWTPQEVKESWKCFLESQEPLNNWFKYFEGIITKTRKTTQKHEQLKESEKKSKKPQHKGIKECPTAPIPPSIDLLKRL